MHMERDTDKKPPRIVTDPDFGGMSAGAQDGGIVDAGAADNETPYSDAIAGRKGGMLRNDTDDSYVDTSEFDSMDAESGGEGIGSAEGETGGWGSRDGGNASTGLGVGNPGRNS
jgi:hypothetical protein